MIVYVVAKDGDKPRIFQDFNTAKRVFSALYNECEAAGSISDHGSNQELTWFKNKNNITVSFCHTVIE